MRLRNVFLYCFGLVLLLANGLAAQSTEGFSKGELLKAAVQDYMRQQDIPGLGIVLADANGIIWSAAYGTADLQKHRPFTVETMSHVASVSKTVTALAIMKLVEQGKVDLDQPYQKYVPEFNPQASAFDAKAVSVRSILTHQSGLASDVWFNVYQESAVLKTMPGKLEPALAAANSVPLCAQPGTVRSYSNLGFGLLGVLVERVSGQGLQDFVSREILKPAGIVASGYDAGTEKPANFATGYLNGQGIMLPYFRDVGAVSFNFNTNELGKYASLLLRAWQGKSPVISRKSMEALFSPILDTAKHQQADQIGLAWMELETDDFKAMFHGGDWGPYHAQLVIIPEHDIAVAIMVNGGSLNSSNLLVFLNAARKYFGPEKGLIDAKPKEIVHSAVTDRFPADQFKQLVGVYYSEKGYTAAIRRSFPRLILDWRGERSDLEHHPDGTITIAKKIASQNDPIVEIKNGNLEIRQDGILIETLFPLTHEAINGAWSARAGDYQVVVSEKIPLFTRMKLGLIDTVGLGMLLSGNENSSYLPLSTDSGDLAHVSGTGRGRGDGVRVVMTADGEELEYSGYRFRKVP